MPKQVLVETQEENLPSIPEEMKSIGVRQIEVEFQKHILDVSKLQLSTYIMWCGWRVVKRDIRIKKLGRETIKSVDKILIDKNARIINESGADWVMNSIMPLIFPSTTTSNLTDVQIYKLFRGRRNSMLCTLADTYYKKEYKNPYDLKPDRIPDISTYITQLYAITSKAKGGFTLRELVESIVSQHISQSVQQPIQQIRPPTLVERLTGTGRGGNS